MAGIPLDTVITTLKKLYPNADCTLDYTNPLELFVATVLSAQCTDARVNIVTKSLFKKYRTPYDYVSVPREELEKDVFTCGTYHAKARAIQESCQRMIDHYEGKVPDSMEELLTMRGIGRKSASIILAHAYGVIAGIPVDTHVTRLSHRLGLTKKNTQDAIEKDLMSRTPQKDWVMLSHVLVAHGRAVCNARSPNCAACVFRDTCPSSRVRTRK